MRAWQFWGIIAAILAGTGWAGAGMIAGVIAMGMYAFWPKK